MDCTQVGILKKANKVSFRCLLESKDCSGLKAEIRLEVLGNLTDKTLERSLANKQVSGLLILSNLTKSNSSWAVTVGLLDCRIICVEYIVSNEACAIGFFSILTMILKEGPSARYLPPPAVGADFRAALMVKKNRAGKDW